MNPPTGLLEGEPPVRAVTSHDVLGGVQLVEETESVSPAHPEAEVEES
jgi:hypothetical protein